MANESEILWVDVENNALLSGWEANTTATTPVFKQGDNIKVEIHFVKRVSTQRGIFFEEVPTAGSSFKLAVGNPDTLPTGGFWTLSFGSETADFLYNASAASVETALNAFTNITALGGVTVEKVNGETTYRISFNNKVALPYFFSGDPTNLLPSSTVIADEIKVGSATTKGVWHIKSVQVPIAYQSSWTPQSSAVITATALQLGTTRVKISPAPKDGTFSLSVGTATTAPISVFATELEVQNAITDVVTSGTYEVKKSGSFIWDVSQTSGNLVLITADGAGLISFDAVVGELNFNNYETASLLAGATTKNTTLEIEMTTGATVATVLQTRCTIVANLIGENVYAPTPFEEHITEAPEDGNSYARKDGGWVSFEAGISQADADVRYANITGDTFTGKVNFSPSASTASLNIGTYASGVAPTSSISGDIWIADNLVYKNQAGGTRTVLNTSTAGIVTVTGASSVFTLNQNGSGSGLVVNAGASSTSPAIKITNSGTGESLRVEDESPESTPFVVGSDGRVGIHGTPATDTNHKLAIYNGNIVFSNGYGLAFGDGTTQTTAASPVDLTGYATEAWVTGQGYVTYSGAGSLYHPLNGYPIDRVLASGYTNYYGSAVAIWNITYYDPYAMMDFTIMVTVTAPEGQNYNNWAVAFTEDYTLGNSFIDTNTSVVYVGVGGGGNAQDAVNILSGSGSGGLPSGWSISFDNGASPYAQAGVLVSSGTLYSPQVGVSISSSFVLSGGVLPELTSNAIMTGNHNKVLASDAAGIVRWTEPTSLLSNVALLSGATFTGKVNFVPAGGAAGLNIGIGGTSGSTIAGDLWIASGGTNLNFRDASGAWRVTATQGQTNTFTTNQIISGSSSSAMLRITQTGTGKALIIEDETSPDGTGTVIDQNGSVGIGVTNTFTATHKLEVVGAVKANSITFNGTQQFKVNSTAAHGGGSNTHDLFISYGGSTYRIPMIFVSTP